MEENIKTVTPEKAEAREASRVERTKDRATFVPAVDITEDDSNLYIFADMPGADEKGVNVSLENDVLTIDAPVEDQKFEGHGVSCAEYGVGDYHRVFTLNEAIDRDRIEARLKNGVLSIVLPKAEEAKTRSIPIKVG